MTRKIDRNSEGVFIIAATPFASDGALDLDSTDRMVDFYLDCGVSGMTILGIMGDAPKLSGEESTRFAQHVLDRVAGRVPVVVGVSGAGLDNMARLSHGVMEAGAAGVSDAPFTIMPDPRSLERAVGDFSPFSRRNPAMTAKAQMRCSSICAATTMSVRCLRLAWQGFTREFFEFFRARARSAIAKGRPRADIHDSHAKGLRCSAMTEYDDGPLFRCRSCAHPEASKGQAP
jgi:hypothetical protein